MGMAIKSKAVYTGRNYDVGSFRDDRYVRCSRCGWINNLDQAIHSSDGGYEGWGTSFVTVTSTSGGSGFGPKSPSDTMQTPGPSGQLMYSTSLNSTDTLVNTYGTFSFGLNNVLLLNGATTGSTGVMLLLFNAQIYYISSSSQWFIYTGSWVSISGDPRKNIGTLQLYDSNIAYDSSNPYDSLEPYIETTMDAVVGAGCAQCGTLLYTK